MVDMTAQIRIIESLLRQEQNKECADCNSKTPRWASTTFGTFICLRCSGKHRELQVHITKVKSVNLDKWPVDLLEMYKHMNNALLNCYWEARLPSSYQKPGQNSTPSEVMSFITQKYVQKKWIDTGAKADLASLYKTDKKKFEKLKASYISGKAGKDESEEEESEDEEERRQRRKDRKEKKKAKKQQDEKPQQEKFQKIQKQTQSKPSAPVEDLFSFDSVPQKNQILIDDFSDFQDSQTANTTAANNVFNNSNAGNDGFSDFQGAAGQQHSQQNNQVNVNPTLNIQNLYNMYNQSPNFVQQQAPNNKYSALDALGQYGAPSVQGPAYGGIQNPNQQFQQQNQMMPGFGQQQAFGGMQQNMGAYQPQRQADPFAGLQGSQGQTNMFSGMNMTINLQYGQTGPQYQNPLQQQQQQFGVNPNLNQFAGNPQQNSFPNQAFGGLSGGHNFHHQHSAPQLIKPNNAANLYGGLVDLNNLGGQNNMGSAGFGQSGFGGFQGGISNNPAQKKDVFSGLLSGQF
ncbi:arf gtpase activating protein [Stylonychia lemnae]|uniref:Arf gtpase activating protein n=1 Tax=Stylonychia lemnae TaxID=5949 RepID=A0A078ABN0_STYLE|nr:arf gtpase activating protein [Stylonychia lemnae]|eukprot:CDW78188.1 arf gtpase activating protein [Stylonychia lemnae]